MVLSLQFFHGYIFSPSFSPVIESGTLTLPEATKVWGALFHLSALGVILVGYQLLERTPGVL